RSTCRECGVARYPWCPDSSSKLPSKPCQHIDLAPARPILSHAAKRHGTIASPKLLMNCASAPADPSVSEDLFIPWVLQRATILTALFAGLVPAVIANLKQRPVLRWYCYGFACTLVAWPLITLPTIHALVLRPRTTSPEARQRQRRADALA